MGTCALHHVSDKIQMSVFFQLFLKLCQAEEVGGGGGLSGG